MFVLRLPAFLSFPTCLIATQPFIVTRTISIRLNHSHPNTVFYNCSNTAHALLVFPLEPSITGTTPPAQSSHSSSCLSFRTHLLTPPYLHLKSVDSSLSVLVFLPRTSSFLSTYTSKIFNSGHHTIMRKELSCLRDLQLPSGLSPTRPHCPHPPTSTHRLLRTCW